jgi:hypothetical protein
MNSSNNANFILGISTDSKTPKISYIGKVNNNNISDIVEINIDIVDPPVEEEVNNLRGYIQNITGEAASEKLQQKLQFEEYAKRARLAEETQQQQETTSAERQSYPLLIMPSPAGTETTTERVGTEKDTTQFAAIPPPAEKQAIIPTTTSAEDATTESTEEAAKAVEEARLAEEARKAEEKEINNKLDKPKPNDNQLLQAYTDPFTSIPLPQLSGTPSGNSFDHFPDTGVSENEYPFQKNAVNVDNITLDNLETPTEEEKEKERVRLAEEAAAAKKAEEEAAKAAEEARLAEEARKAEEKEINNKLDKLKEQLKQQEQSLNNEKNKQNRSVTVAGIQGQLNEKKKQIAELENKKQQLDNVGKGNKQQQAAPSIEEEYTTATAADTAATEEVRLAEEEQLPAAPVGTKAKKNLTFLEQYNLIQQQNKQLKKEINKKYDEKRAPLIEQRKQLYKTIKVETSNARKMKKINLSDAEKALLKNQSQLVTDLTKQRKEIINQITDLDLKETEEINNVGKDNTGQIGEGKKTKRNKNKHRKTKRRRTKRRRTKRTK